MSELGILEKLKRATARDIEEVTAEAERRKSAGDEAAYRELVGWIHAKHDVLDKIALLERET